MLQMIYRVTDGHTLKVVNLTAAEDGGQNLMLFCGGQNENHMCWRFLERLQKGVEGCSGKHVNLVDDEHLISTQLRRNTSLFHERLDMLHGVVTGSIEFKDVQ